MALIESSRGFEISALLEVTLTSNSQNQSATCGRQEAHVRACRFWSAQPGTRRRDPEGKGRESVGFTH